ncbi:hypothetical protein N431DRAFT_444438 [Stipitochalara longipes BDJ]|nr:hypothetical protein N431DRAFT_444438 [Stipitochalara longipes BDJ]
MRLHRAAGVTICPPLQPMFALLFAYFFIDYAHPLNDFCTLKSGLFSVMEIATNLPPLVEIDGDSNMNSGLVQTVGSLLFSGHHKWGFLIYRVTYEDDQAWQDFMKVLTSTVEEDLKYDPDTSKFERLKPYMHWTVMEDPSWQDASKDTIREHFRTWIDSRSNARDGLGAERENLGDYSPRYRACLYIDKTSVDAVRSNPDNASVILIDSKFTTEKKPLVLNEYELEEIAEGEYSLEDLEYEDEYDLVEGRTMWDLGWMIMGPSLHVITAAYERLSEGSDSWRTMYKRPPNRYDGRS